MENKGVCNFRVQGFRVAAIASGLKASGALDLALIFSEKEAACAGVFTTNKVKAAPVLLTMENIRRGTARAILVNSGNANACTGPKGIANARETAHMVADLLEIEPYEVLVASTGVIGLPLNMEAITLALPRLKECLATEGLDKVAQAIMTTDKFPKIRAARGKANGKAYSVVAVAKGAGMIMPNMATMLCFVLTDLKIGPEDLGNVLNQSVSKTFNRITVDGDTSTNDCVLALANGTAGNRDLSSKGLEEFQQNLETIMKGLALDIVRDGEGATKVVEVVVRGARDKEEALEAARTISNSALVKTAFYGEDPNWGRIMAALGRAEIHMDPGDVDIWINDIQIVSQGIGMGIENEKKAAQVMVEEEFTLTVDLNQGTMEESMWTCDLTHDYVSINAEYRT